MESNVITYSEYCNVLGITPETTEETGPEWFASCQRKAIRLILKCLAQSHLVPTTRLRLSCLQDQFLEPVIRGIAEEIRFMHDNEIIFDNGWLNANNSFGVGQYSQGPLDRYNIQKIFSSLCPASFDSFDDIGWTYASLTHKLRVEDYYIKSKLQSIYKFEKEE